MSFFDLAGFIVPFRKFWRGRTVERYDYYFNIFKRKTTLGELYYALRGVGQNISAQLGAWVGEGVVHAPIYR